MHAQGVVLTAPINTFAGNGTAGSTGNGGLATAAELNNPEGLAFDNHGNVYISDYNNNQIRVVNAAGVISVFAGTTAACANPTAASGACGDGGPVSAATFNNPSQMQFDTAGNLYIADYTDNRVRKVTATNGVITGSSIITTVAGNGGGGVATISGNGGLATSATVPLPHGIAIDSAGNIYINDQVACVVRKVAAATGNIANFAGNGTCGYAGDGGQANAAGVEIGNGVELALDSAGNLYLGDRSNNVVRKVTASTNVISTYAGTHGTPCTPATAVCGDNGAATSADLTGPAGVFIDSFGNLVIADADGARIRKVTTSTGIITTIAGTGVACNASGTASGPCGDGGLATSATFSFPIDVSLSPTGNVFFTDQYANRVRYLSPPPIFPATQAGSTSPSINVLISTTGTANTIINSITVPNSPSGTPQFKVGTQSGCVIGGTTGNAPGTLCTIPVTFSPAYPGVQTAPLVISTNGGTFQFGLSATGIAPQAILEPGVLGTAAGTGVAGATGNGGAATAATLNAPREITFDYAGNYYIGDLGNNEIREVSAAGNITVVAGGGSTNYYLSPGAAATTAALTQPEQVAFDSAGNMYIPDYGDSVVAKVDAVTKNITVIAGQYGTQGNTGDGGLATAATLTGPAAIAINQANGNIYIADGNQGGNKIREINVSTGIITTYAGTGAICSSPTATCGDGGPATAAQFYRPNGIAIDGNGNIFVSDTLDNRVRRIDVTTGIITTVAGTGAASDTGDGGAATSATLNTPFQIQVDAAGDIFIADKGNNAIRMVSGSTGNISTIAGNGMTCTTTPSPACGDGGSANVAAFSSPTGVALDAAGDVYVVENGTNRVRKVTSNPAALLYPTEPVGTSAGTMNETLLNIGNATLTYTTPVSPNSDALVTTTGPTAATSNAFTQTAATTCGPIYSTTTTGTTLASGATCNFVVNFTPDTAAGNYTGTLVETDNSLYNTASTQTVTLAGAGTILTPVVTLASNNNPSYLGQSVTFTATVTSPNSSAPAPTGSVTFTYTTAAAPSTVITITGSPITVSTTAGVTTAVISTSSLPLGAENVTATYSGDGAYATAASTAFAQTVQQVSGSADTVSAANSTTTVGTADQLTFAIPVVTGAAVPTGSVAFTSGSTSLGNATWPASPVTGTCPSGSGTCYLLSPASAPTNIPLGNPTTVTATYTAGTGSGYASPSTAPTTNVIVNLDPDTITVTSPTTSPAPATYSNGGTIAIAASSTSGQPITYASTTPAVCSVSSTGVVTTLSTGTCNVTLNQTAAGNYAAASQVTQSFTIAAGTDMIAFPTLSNTAYGATAPALAATSTSGQPVTYTSATPSVCTVSGSTVMDVAVGTCTINANQAAAGNYAAASQVSQSYQVTPGTDTITFPALSNTAFGATPPVPMATSTSGQPVTYSTTSTACSVTSSGVITDTAVGSCAITASQAAAGNYAAAMAVTNTFNITPAPDMITFPTPTSQTNPVLAATSTSGQPVTYALATGSTGCTLTQPSTITVVGTGTCSVTASQGAAGNYGAATPVTVSFPVNQVPSASGSTLVQTTTAVAGSQVTLTATVQDTNGLPVAGATVVFTTPNTTATFSTPAVTNTSGVTTVTITDTAAEADTVTGTVNGVAINQQPTVTFVVPAFTVASTGDGPANASACIDTNLPTYTASANSGCTLRDAVAAADALAGVTAPITLPSSGTIALTQGASLPITSAVNLIGPGANALTIDGSGNGTNPIFTVSAGPSKITGVTLANGNSGATGGGAADITAGNLTLNQDALTNDSTTTGSGGAVLNTGTGTVTVSNSTLSGDSSTQGNGGAIANTNTAGTLIVYNTTLYGNTAPQGSGGAILNAGTMTLSNDTFSTNSAINGGAVEEVTTATANEALSIFTANTATGTGAAINASGSTFNSSGNIYYQNTVGGTESDCVSGCTTTGTPITVNPNLAPLGNYGGTTQTMLPLPASSAICSGTAPTLVTPTIGSDQRGVAFGSENGTTGCYPIGAVETNYSISFTTQPSNVMAGAAMSPAPVVTVLENGISLTGGTATVQVSDSQTDLSTSSTLNASTSTAVATAGQAAFSNLQFTNIETSDTLTSTLSLNPALSTPLTLTAMSGTFAVGSLSDTITVTSPTTSPAPATYSNGGTIAIAASSTSGQPITYASTTPATCSVSATGVVTTLSTGTCTVTLNQAAAGNYAAATQVSQSFTIGAGTDTITFPALPNTAYGATPPTPAATSTSGQPVTYSTTSTACSVTSAGVITDTAVGSCAITASQPAAGNYAAATPVTNTFNITAATDTITVTSPTTSPAPATYSNGGTIAIAASSTSGQPITYASTTPATCSVSATGVVTTLSTGTCTVTLNQAAAGNYAAATQVSQSFTIGAGTDTITFPALPNTAYGATPPTPAATSTSGQPVTYSTTSTACSVTSAGVITDTAVGSCAITASQPAAGNYAAATPVTNTFNITAGTDTIMVPSTVPTTIPYSNGGTFPIGATTTSGAAPTYTSTTPLVCSVSSAGVVTTLSTGTCSVTVSQPAAGNYAAATPQTVTVAVTSGTDTITFPALPNTPFGATAPTPSATSTSGQPVMYTSATPTVCTVSGSTITDVAVGTCTINANQAAAGNYSAAAQVSQSYNVTAATDTITVTSPTSPDSVSYTSNGTVAIAASSTSGQPLTYATSSTACSVSSTGVVAEISTGSCVVTISQPASGNYAAGTPQTVTINIGAGTDVITVPTTVPTTATVGGAPISIGATSTSGQPVTYTSTTPTVCTVSSTGVVTTLTSGTCSVTVSQPAAGNYAASTPQTVTIQVAGQANTINFPTLANTPIGSTPPVPMATATSGQPVTYTSTTPATCSVTAAGVVTDIAIGQCTLTASQAASSTYAAAASVSQSFNITPLPDTITIPPTVPTSVVAGATVSIGATTTSGVTPIYTSTTPAVCTVSAAGVVTTLTNGTCSVTVSQAAAGNYTAATPQTVTIQVAANADTITVPATVPTATTLGSGPISLGATSTSGQPITYTSTTPAVCSVSSTGVVTAIAPGTCMVTASQPASGSYAAATPVVVTIQVAPATNTITIPPVPPTFPLNGGTFSIGATATSGVPPTYTSTTPSVCSVSATGVVTVLTSGTCTITVSQAATGVYAAAPTQTVSTVVINVYEFTITANAPLSQTVAPGGTVVYTYALAPVNGQYPGPVVNYTVTGLPPGSTYTITPASGTIPNTGGPQTLTLTINTAHEMAMNRMRQTAPWTLAVLLPLFFLRRKRRQLAQALMVFMVLAASTFAITGCATPNGFLGQQPANYSIVVTATSGAITHSAVAVNLQVQ